MKSSISLGRLTKDAHVGCYLEPNGEMAIADAGALGTTELNTISLSLTICPLQ